MEQRISLITLGVRSVRRAEGVAFFQCGGLALSLYPRADLAVDAGISLDEGGHSAFSIAYNTRTRQEVDTVLAQAEACGAEVVRPARQAAWGGYSGYFRDLDGHLWEVAWNPGFPIEEDGSIRLPD
ncbi:MAG: VOC family protein [Acetobacteraceae bacterium]|nr:VOC family protein [Acetobacteraceae bacterium]